MQHLWNDTAIRAGETGVIVPLLLQIRKVSMALSLLQQRLLTRACHDVFLRPMATIC